MIQPTEEKNLLDLLAESFLQQGASVSYEKVSGIPCLKVISEDDVPRWYMPADIEVLKMSIWEKLDSKEIFIPLLKPEEELQLKALVVGLGMTTG